MTPNTTTRCPHCGADRANYILTSIPPKYPFQCGSYEGYQSDLCKKGQDQINAMSDTTTPRTDALIEELKRNPIVSGCDRVLDYARQLERELQKAEWNANTLQASLNVSELNVRKRNERIDELEAEVALLKSKLRRAVEIAECGLVGPASRNLRAELDAIRATLPETK
jgi:hypothetical protein